MLLQDSSSNGNRPSVAAGGRACCPTCSVVGCAVPSVPRAPADKRNASIWTPSPGALGTARPTFTGSGGLGNMPGSRRLLRHEMSSMVEARRQPRRGGLCIGWRANTGLPNPARGDPVAGPDLPSYPTQSRSPLRGSESGSGWHCYKQATPGGVSERRSGWQHHFGSGRAVPDVGNDKLGRRGLGRGGRRSSKPLVAACPRCAVSPASKSARCPSFRTTAAPGDKEGRVWRPGP